MTREPIFAALFALVSGSWNFNTTSRRLKHWNDVSPAEQPALFLTQGSQIAQVPFRGMPTKWTLKAEIYLYAHSGGTADSVPATVLNQLIDAVEKALTPTGGLEVQTLGNLVSHCWISGDIKTDEGALGDQAVAIIPIDILVNA